MRTLIVSAIVTLTGSALAAEVPVKFTKKPTARREGKTVKIEFAADRRTDVAVFIEDAKGRIVRHLAAGVLGKNAPKPLKADSLSQSIEWDGKADYGRPAGAGPFRVRVTLGLGAKYDKILLGGDGRDQVYAGASLATGPDGKLYIVHGYGAGGPGWGGQKMIAVNRDGSYSHTVLPFPATHTKEQQEALGAAVMDLEGRAAPVVSNVKGQRFIDIGVRRKAGMAVTPRGAILTLMGQGRIGAVTPQGTAPWGNYAGPRLLPGAGLASGSVRKGGGRPGIAVSADGKRAYVSGLISGKKGLAAAYRVKLPERAPAEPFFGDPAETGNDESHLGGAPRGLAVDGKGHLLIADYANNRVVVVREKDGEFVKSFEVKAPDCLAVDQKTGAVYLTRLTGGGRVELVKLKSWEEPRELAKMSVRREGNPDFPWLMALDAGAKPPVVWMGGDYGKLLRIEDAGGEFGDARQLRSDKFGDGSFADVSVNRFGQDPEIHVRGARYWWHRLNERTGEMTRVRLRLGANDGSSLVTGPGGVIYAQAYPCHLKKFDYGGKPTPWKDPVPYTEAARRGKYFPFKNKKVLPGWMYVPFSMTYLGHTMTVCRDGHIFILEPGLPGGRPPKMLVEYLPSGKRIDKPVIWKVSDVAVGPRFDPQGNIYIAEHIKPVGQPYPPELLAALGLLPAKRPMKYQDWIKTHKYQVAHMYGSILKFTPKGGMVHWPSLDPKNDRKRMSATGIDPFKGQPELDPRLKRTKAEYYHHYGSTGNVEVTGAEWIRMGISHIEMYGCNCQNVRFDVDEFGRVFYPDLGRFRVVVLDTAGNEITHFGGYGNAESAGPESEYPKPEIAFAWLVGVVATDKYVYTGDSMNRRLLRAKLLYAAEETCGIR